MLTFNSNLDKFNKNQAQKKKKKYIILTTEEKIRNDLSSIEST